MKFSERTSTILKNFALINQSVVFKPGKELRTISPLKTVMAVAKIEDEIPSKAIIFDINRLLSVASLVSPTPDYAFGEKEFTITDGSKKTRYAYADESMVIAPPEKEIKIPSADVEVQVKWDDLSAVIKACSVLQLPEVAFIGDGEKLYLRSFNSDNDKSIRVAEQANEAQWMEIRNLSRSHGKLDKRLTILETHHEHNHGGRRAYDPDVRPTEEDDV